MNTVTPREKTSPVNLERINKMVEALQEKMIYLRDRWVDESEYEEINDYASHIMGLLPDGFVLTKMTKKPFGFYFTIGTEAVYHYIVTSKFIEWKRVK